MSKLVFIGGPPAVGKSSVLAYLERAFERCACLDADDAWRVHPFEVNDATGEIWQGNIIAVLRGYLEAGYPFVFLTWVLANPQLIDRLLHGLDGLYGSALVLHLVASPEALKERYKSQPERGHSIEYALFKLKQIEGLPYPKIDTTDLEPEAVSDRIIAQVSKGAAQQGDEADRP